MNVTSDDRILQYLSSVDQRGAWLITVAATWGSSPRPAGSLLLIGSDGREIGSVSGGCVEADLIERSRTAQFDRERPNLIIYGADGNDTRRFGLPCGGRLQLIVECITDPRPWQTIFKRVAARGVVSRRLCVDTAEARLDSDPPVDTADFVFEQQPGGRYATRLFGPRWQLIVIGAEHIARHLVPIARSLGYRVVVCDPRRDRLAQFRPFDREDGVDAGVELDSRMPDDCVRNLADDARSAVVALTHDPKLDDLALLEALTSRAFYVGALGSRRSQHARRTRLAELGLPATAIDRLKGPVGLDLGGRTPAEIAVSIAAELIACRNHPEGGDPSRTARRRAYR